MGLIEQGRYNILEKVACPFLFMFFDVASFCASGRRKGGNLVIRL
jgi:hypothetical protein